ncbi:UNVERIFIED_CONTAM: hypothetical protein GTU68_055843 [Idotea baltica]|nr:hypothetical protein [Idotea baltica]
MKNLRSIFFVLLFSVSAFSADRPNILLILADDLSWSDLGSYGHPLHETPNLDKLASEGLRFTDAYSSAPICSASRAALMTGKTTARLGFEFVVKPEPGSQMIPGLPLKSPPFTLDLPLREKTVAEMLAEGGYETAFFGKWHLNQHYKRYLGWSPTHGPKAQGFQTAEEDFGSHPYSYWKAKKNRNFDTQIAEGEFPQDSMVKRANAFLQKSHEKPFFLMVSHFFVHDPNHTRLEWLYEKYFNQLSEDDSRREKKAHYASMVTTLDQLVGETLDALEKSGKADWTLVIFTSDNGGHPNYAGNAPLRGSKWNLYEGGIRVPMIARWPGTIPAGETCEAPVIGYDLFPTFAELAKQEVDSEIDGRSMLPLLKSPTANFAERSLIWHFPYYHPEKKFADAPKEIGIDDGVASQTRPHSATRLGSQSLLHFYETGERELYNLDADRAEQSAVNNGPEVESMGNMLDEYLNKVNARMPK